MSWLIQSPFPSAPPSIVGASYAYYNSQSSQTLTMPSGWSVGDLMVLTVIMLGEQGYPTSASVSGWTLHDTFLGSGTGASRTTIYRKTAASGQGNVTIAFSSSGYRQVILAVYHNVSAIQQYKFLEDTSSPYNTDSLSVSTTPGYIGIIVSGARFESGTAYDPGAVTINNNNHLTKYGTGRGALTHIDTTSAATYGPYTCSWANTISRARTLVMELR